MKQFLLIVLALLSINAIAQESPSSNATTIHPLICAEPANIVKDIPQEIEYITVYTQYRKPKSAAEKVAFGEAPYLCPYVIRFEDSTTLSILQKQMKKVAKRLKKVPVDMIEFDGFELTRIGNMQDDEAAQRALATVQSYGFHDYAKRDTPVYYYSRKRD